jgi:hypothetical protein
MDGAGGPGLLSERAAVGHPQKGARSFARPRGKRTRISLTGAPGCDTIRHKMLAGTATMAFGDMQGTASSKGPEDEKVPQRDAE